MVDTHSNKPALRKKKTPSTAPILEKAPGQKRAGRPKKNQVNERPPIPVTGEPNVVPITHQVVSTGIIPPIDAGPAQDGTIRVDEKDEEIRRLQALLAAAQAVAPPATPAALVITQIPRPKGEAGDRKKGFVLIDAMQLDGTAEETAMYSSIVTTTRLNCIRANLNRQVDYRHQDPEKQALPSY